MVTWCAAWATGLSHPISTTANANTPTSAPSCPPMGAPMRIIRRSRAAAGFRLTPANGARSRRRST